MLKKNSLIINNVLVCRTKKETFFLSFFKIKFNHEKSYGRRGAKKKKDDAMRCDDEEKEIERWKGDKSYEKINQSREEKQKRWKMFRLCFWCFSFFAIRFCGYWCVLSTAR